MPLQSGSSKVLHEMARHYDANEYLQVVNTLKNKIPNIALSTDIIVGFPGETEADFQESIELSKKCAFMKIHVFPYSKRAGTPAAERMDQISDEVKASRAKVLRSLSDELANADYKYRNGTTELVLVEDKNHARTESYHQIDAPKNAKVGDLVSLKL